MAQIAACLAGSEVVMLAAGKFNDRRDGRFFLISIPPEVVQGESWQVMTTYGDARRLDDIH